MEYNEYIGDETIDIEYKKFTFNLTGLNFSMKKLEEYYKTHHFDFNNLVIANIKAYFKTFVPKYLCGFFNSNISGKMIIGVNDWGFVKGIPYQGDLPINILTCKLYKYLEKRIRVKNKQYNFRDFVKITCTKLNYNEKKQDTNINPHYTKYMEAKEIFMNILQKEKEAFNDWKIRYAFVTRKLVDLLNHNESRQLIINYIQNTDPESSVIKILRTDENIISLSHEEISVVVKNKCNPYYWVSEWKDYICDKLKKEKPQFTYYDFTPTNTPYSHIISISDMIPWWMEHNDNMNLYIIMIEMNYNPHMDKGWSFYDEQIKDYVQCARIMGDNNEPSIQLMLTT